MKPILTREIYDDGVQEFYKFDNNYGASVVQHTFRSTGDLWEIAPIKFKGSNIDDWDFVKVKLSGISKPMKRESIYDVLQFIKDL